MTRRGLFGALLKTPLAAAVVAVRPDPARGLFVCGEDRWYRDHGALYKAKGPHLSGERIYVARHMPAAILIDDKSPWESVTYCHFIGTR